MRRLLAEILAVKRLLRSEQRRAASHLTRLSCSILRSDSPSAVSKEYLVEVQRDQAWGGERGETRTLNMLREGLSLNGHQLLRAGVSLDSGMIEKGATLRMTLREGKKRQIRHMCEMVGLRVTRLHRIRVGGLKLGELLPGQWRLFDLDELLHEEDG